MAFLKQVRSCNEQTRRLGVFKSQIASGTKSTHDEDLEIAGKLSQIQAYLASLIAKNKPLRIIIVDLLSSVDE